MVIEEIGRALWGERWQAEMARALKVHRDTVQDWAKERYQYRPEVIEQLRELLQERRVELARLEAQLAPTKERKMSCPACEGKLSNHPTTFDGSLYECVKHGAFGVSRSAEASGFWKLDKRIQQSAYKNAETRGKKNPSARNDPRPATLIMTYDF
jgi:hypothetical protein